MIEDPNLEASTLNLAELRAQLAPSISTRDVLEHYKNNQINGILLIDLRENFDFSHFHVLKSINIPFSKLDLNSLISANGGTDCFDYSENNDEATCGNNLLVKSILHNPDNNGDCLRVIYGTREMYEKAVNVANCLVRMKFSKICLIRNGIESFITTDIIYRK